MLGYVLAVLHRTSFGVAGLEAAERFSVSPAALSSFVFLQVAVYAAAQIPGGLVVDRFGARIVLTAASGLLATGQLVLAFAPSLPMAVLARVLVGAGDGIILVAVLALVPRWFPGPRVPLVTQLTTILSQVGLVLSAVPFVGLLHRAGWSPAFALAAAASAAAAGVAPGGGPHAPRGGGGPAPPGPPPRLRSPPP